jgi:hypothetical protein
MKRVLYILTAITFIFVADSMAQNMKVDKNTRPVEYQRYDSYFEKNNSGLRGKASYLVLANQEQFDKVFGSAAAMEQNSFLPPDVFKSKLVFATIKRGSLRHYDEVKVTAGNGKLVVWYNAKDDAPSSATYSTPLILTVDKGKYNEVVFMENGKKAGAVKFKKQWK